MDTPVGHIRFKLERCYSLVTPARLTCDGPMKTLAKNSSPQKLIGEIQIARLQVAKAESQLVSAKELARIARRRRKEAKQAARHAKKQARLAKREFTDAKLAVAELEERLARFEQRVARAKAKPKPVKKVAHAGRGKKLVSRAGSTSLKGKAVVKPKRTRSRAEPARKVTSRGVRAPRDLAMHDWQSPEVVHPATAQTAKGTEGMLVGEIEPGRPADFIQESQPAGNHRPAEHL